MNPGGLPKSGKRAVEVVSDSRDIGDGMGGIREDKQQFDMGAEI